MIRNLKTNFLKCENNRKTDHYGDHCIRGFGKIKLTRKHLSNYMYTKYVHQKGRKS